MKVLKKIAGKKAALLIFKFLIFLCILFTMDFCIGRIIKHYYFKPDFGISYRTTYAIDSTKAEFLILGSSYANRHLIPKQFESKFNMSVYNAGRDGNYIFYHYAILKALLKRYTPKVILLDFNFAGFEKDALSYESMSSLLPYYEDHPEIRSIIQLKGQFENFKLISKIYPYNSLVLTIINDNLDLNKMKSDEYEDHGFVPLFNIWDQSISIDTLPKKYELDPKKINIFKCFIKTCQKADVKLYIVVSPRIIKYKYEDPSIILAASIAKDFEVPFYNFLNDTTIINHPRLFADRHHLNNSGAIVYSNEVVKTILKNDNPILLKSSNNAEE